MRVESKQRIVLSILKAMSLLFTTNYRGTNFVVLEYYTITNTSLNA